MPVKPSSFMITTGHNHLSRADEFDNAIAFISPETRIDVHYVPGELAFRDEEVKFYRER